MTELETIPDLAADWIRRVVSYSEELTYFAENSVGQAIARATAEQVGNNGSPLYRALLRRQTLLGASGAALVEVAEEHGVPQLGPSRARVLLVLSPWSAQVTAITGSLIAVDDSTHVEVGDSIRLTNSDGSVSEILTVGSISTGTGPDGEDELDVGAISGTYEFTGPAADDNRILVRRTLVAGTSFQGSSGVAFQSLADVTVGDRNPVLRGESTALALADKVECEAVDAGEAGNVAAFTIDALTTPDPKIRAVTNPSRAEDGRNTESDFDLKYRAAHQGQLAAVETHAAVEALARAGDRSVLRAFEETSESINTILIRVITRSGGGLTTNARAALGAFVAARLRSRMSVEIRNVVPTAVEITATVSLSPGQESTQARLEAAWRLAADRYATLLDWRKWIEGTPVDEAELLSILRQTPGIAAVTTSTFTPAAEVEVETVPQFTRLVLTDLATGATFGADLTTSY